LGDTLACRHCALQANSAKQSQFLTAETAENAEVFDIMSAYRSISSMNIPQSLRTPRTLRLMKNKPNSGRSEIATAMRASQ
jgi:hypothetical protein